LFAIYRAVFRAPGTAAFCAAGFLMRMPIAVYPLGLLLLISTKTHHYGFAGALSGAYILGGAPGNPIGARLVDRFGQGRVLLPAAAVHVAAVVALIAISEAGLADWLLLTPAAIVGFSYLAVGSLVRARWSHVLEGRPELSTAYSLESTLDEVIFVVGPLLATVLATQVDPVAPLVLSGVLVALGSFALWRLPATEPPAHPVGAPRQQSALRSRGMTLIICVSFAMGAIFASAEVTTVAFAGQHRHQGLAGFVLASFALGSGTAGLLYGARHWLTPIVDRFRLQALIFAALTLLLLLASSIPLLAVLIFIVGLGIAPTLITAFGLIAEIVPARSLTEGLAWLTTGLNLGYGAASSLCGRLADAHGARITFLVTVGAGVLMAGFALAIHARLRPLGDPAMSVPRGTIG
jgi:MFS family permease